MVKECINKFAIYLREDLKMFPKFSRDFLSQKRKRITQIILFLWDYLLLIYLFEQAHPKFLKNTNNFIL